MSNVISRICQEIQLVVDRSGVECQVFGRRKTPYSIWRKMQTKNMLMEHLADVMGFRLIVPTKPIATKHWVFCMKLIPL